MSTATTSEDREPVVYRVEDVAQKLSLGVSTLYRLMNKGQIEYHLIGTSTRRISGDELKRFLERTRVTKES